MAFRQPRTGRELAIEAPMPADMAALAAAVGLPSVALRGIAGMSVTHRARSRRRSRRQPRMALATLPTPLQEARATARGARRTRPCPRILIKRDDLTSLGLGGNKARKLEYLVADARAQGATTLITTGAVQSNHARMTAAAACVAGMRCVLVLTATQRRSRRSPATCLLDKLYGATIRLVPSIDPMLAVGQDEAVVAEVVAEERAAGACRT